MACGPFTCKPGVAAFSFNGPLQAKGDSVDAAKRLLGSVMNTSPQGAAEIGRVDTESTYSAARKAAGLDK